MNYGDYVLDFSYDINGVPVAMRHGYASHNNYVVYYYITNLQGDVIRLVDVNGNTAAYYEYDPYGNAIQAAGSHANVNPLRYRGYVYDTETGFYYLQSRYYDPKLGRFINADTFVSTGQGIIGNNMFSYCGNNPVGYIDPLGAAYEPIGAGFQFEIDVGNGTVGIEIIAYWDVEECRDGGLVVAVYRYGGVSVSCNDPLIGSMLAVITDNSQILSDGNEEAIIAIASMLSDTFDISVSGVLITGNEDFVNTESYNGSFTSIGGNLGKVRGSVAYSENCVGYALGYNIVGSSFSTGWGISKTIYKQIYESTIFGETENSTNRRVGGGKF